MVENFSKSKTLCDVFPVPGDQTCVGRVCTTRPFLGAIFGNVCSAMPFLSATWRGVRRRCLRTGTFVIFLHLLELPAADVAPDADDRRNRLRSISLSVLPVNRHWVTVSVFVLVVAHVNISPEVSLTLGDRNHHTVEC